MSAVLDFRMSKRKGCGWLPKYLMLYIDPAHGATWRSGYATVCKTVYTSSILVVASIHIINGLRLIYERPDEASSRLAGGVPALRKRNQRPRGAVVVGGARRLVERQGEG